MNGTAATGLLVLLSLIACAPRDPSTPPQEVRGQAEEYDRMSYRAESHLLERHPATVSTVATVTNASGETREVTFPDGCAVLIRAYRDAERTAPPAWDQEQAAVCTLALRIVELAPGDSVLFQMEATVPDILGDSLPTRRYYVGALLRPDQGRVEVPAGGGGSRELTRPTLLSGVVY